MPQNSYCRLPCGHRFRPKCDLMFMAPNHGGNPLGSILGPMGSHWVQKMGQNRKKLPCPKFEFWTTPQSSISAKIRPYGYGAKSRWESPRVYLGANGVPLGPKNGSKPLKVTMPHNSNFRPPRCHRFRPKCDLTVMAPNHGGDPLGSILGPMGSHGVQKMPNHGGDPLGSILGPMGSHWVKKMGQNRKNLPCP